MLVGTDAIVESWPSEEDIGPIWKVREEDGSRVVWPKENIAHLKKQQEETSASDWLKKISSVAACESFVKSQQR